MFGKLPNRGDPMTIAHVDGRDARCQSPLAMATPAQAASLSFIAERLMGLQMVVVGSMAIALFAMLRKRGENDAEGEDPMTVSEDDDDDGATAAERRVARASLAALGVGIFAAAIVYTTSYT